MGPSKSIHDLKFGHFQISPVKKASGCHLCASVIMFGGLDHFLSLLSGKSLAALMSLTWVEITGHGLGLKNYWDRVTVIWVNCDDRFATYMFSPTCHISLCL